MMRLVRWSLAVAIGLGLSQQPSEAQTVGPVVVRANAGAGCPTTGGKTVRLADFRGKTLVINVWGSWCPPCRLETPDLIAEAKAEAPRGVAFLGVDTTETADVVRAFVAAKGVPYAQAVTSGTSAFAKAYDIRNYPTTLVIGPDGVRRGHDVCVELRARQDVVRVASTQHGTSAPLNTAFQAQLDAL